MHSNIISLMNNMGIELDIGSSLNGVCHGLERKASEAFLLGPDHFERYQKRKKAINNPIFFNQFIIFIKYIEELKENKGEEFNKNIHKINVMELKNYNKLLEYTGELLNKPVNELTLWDVYQEVYLEIRAFLEAVSIAQAPQSHESLFFGHIGIVQSNFSLTNSLTQSKSSEDTTKNNEVNDSKIVKKSKTKDGLHVVASFVGSYNNMEMEKYLSLLEKTFTKGRVAIRLEAGSHTFMLAYDAENSCWSIEDSVEQAMKFNKKDFAGINQALRKCFHTDAENFSNLSLDSVMDIIRGTIQIVTKELFSNENELICSTTVYAIGDEQGETIKSRLEALFNTREWEDLHSYPRKSVNDIVTLLSIAAKAGDITTVRKLIDAGVNVNALNKNGSTPLHMAASENHPEIVQLLVDAGANVKALNKHGSTPLHIAEKLGYEKISKILTTSPKNLGWTSFFKPIVTLVSPVSRMMVGHMGHGCP